VFERPAPLGSSSKHLKILRTPGHLSAEILAFSLGLLHGQTIDDMNDDLETIAGCRSLLHGPAPTVHGATTASEEQDTLVQQVRTWLSSGAAPSEIGIAARSNHTVDAAVAALGRAGVPAVALSGGAAPKDAIAVGTMHRMKGLEFRCVLVTGVTDGQVPPPAAVTPAETDAVTNELDLLRERCLLFVACTRAREELAVTWSVTPSQFLPQQTG
jgi:superfamily I DNA/RNA helicase